MTSSSVHWVDSQRELDQIGRRLEQAEVISVDTEQDSFYSYRTKICVIQVGAFGQEWVIDALALDDFSALSEPLRDPTIPTLLHAGENDVHLLRKDCQLEIRGLFDSMSAAGITGEGRTGLAPLLAEHFGIVIEKKYQRSDWRKRPLEREQIEYAALDVRYLPKLRELFLDRLEELGREEEAQSDFERIERVTHPVRTFDPDAYYRLRDARSLDGVGLRVLRDLFVFREQIADREDRAVFRVCPDYALLSLVRRRPRGAGQLERIRGLSDRFRQRYGRELTGVIEAAEQRGPLESPRKRHFGEPHPFQLDARLKREYDRLRRWRTSRAEQRGVEPGRVIPNALLLQVVLERPESKEGLREAGLEPWRIREYGEDLLVQLNQ